MTDSRQRFEEWVAQMAVTTVGGINAWSAWQAAEAQAVRRCAEIADRLAVEYRAKYKGLPGADGIRRGGSYDPHDDGISDGAALVDDAIRAEFPEAFE